MATISKTELCFIFLAGRMPDEFFPTAQPRRWRAPAAHDSCKLQALNDKGTHYDS